MSCFLRSGKFHFSSHWSDTTKIIDLEKIKLGSDRKKAVNTLFKAHAQNLWMVDHADMDKLCQSWQSSCFLIPNMLAVQETSFGADVEASSWLYQLSLGRHKSLLKLLIKPVTCQLALIAIQNHTKIYHAQTILYQQSLCWKQHFSTSSPRCFNVH